MMPVFFIYGDFLAFNINEIMVVEFAKALASNADLFVNDAFGTAHRAHASTAGVTAFLKPSVSGFLLQKELEYLQV